MSFWLRPRSRAGRPILGWEELEGRIVPAVAAWSSGGSGVNGVATDSSDTSYVVGSTTSTDFAGANNPVITPEPWKARLLNFPVPSTADGQAVLDGKLYFAKALGEELWKSDGSPGGAVLVKNLTVGIRPSSISAPFVKANDIFFFNVIDPFEGAQLWRSDGTSAGTFKLKAIQANPQFSLFPDVEDANAINNCVVSGGVLYFGTDNTSLPQGRLWRSDGTPEGTYVVKEWQGAGRPSDFHVANGKIFFKLNDGVNDNSLFVSDGTTDGTKLLVSAKQKAYAYDLTAAGPLVFFTAVDVYYSGKNDGLWRSDGTPEGTFRVSDRFRESDVSNMRGENGRVFFSHDDGASGAELWTSDGTAAGTRMVADIVEGLGGSGPSKLTMFNGKVYFVAQDRFNGSQLWSSDGTAANTTIFVMSPWFSPVRILGRLNDRLVLAVPSSTGSWEMRSSDGTTTGTSPIPLSADLAEASLPSKGSLNWGRPTVDGNAIYWRTSVGFVTVAPFITTAPAAPKNVVGAPGSTQVRLTWTAPADDGGSPATDYFVQVSADDGRTWKRFPDGVRTDPVAKVTGLTNGTSYRFRVAAVNSAGKGSYSSPSVAVTPRPAAPAAPSAVQASPGAGRVSLAWTAPGVDGGATITDYFVQMSTDGGRTWTRYLDGVRADTAAKVTGLTGGTSYRFRVAAVNSAGIGGYSAASAVVIPRSAVPDRPTDVKGTPGAGRVTLTWKAPLANGAAITDYFIQVSVDNGLTWRRFLDEARANASATVTGLTTGRSYLFRVAAVNSIGVGGYSQRSGPVTAG